MWNTVHKYTGIGFEMEGGCSCSRIVFINSDKCSELNRLVHSLPFLQAFRLDLSTLNDIVLNLSRAHALSIVEVIVSGPKYSLVREGWKPVRKDPQQILIFCTFGSPRAAGSTGSLSRPFLEALM